MFHLYGLLIGIGVVTGILIAQIHARRWKISASFIEDSLLYIVIPAVIGARLYHVITDWHLYAMHPFPAIFELWKGGLGFFGAFLGGILGIALYSRKQKKPLWSFFTLIDLLAFGAPLAQAIGRVGNYVNQELYGLPTTLPWGIWVHGQRFHPLFAYEALLNSVVFLGINILGLKKKLVLGKGQYAMLYLASYGMIRFWLEFLRIETARWSGILGIFSIAQWVAMLLTISALVLFWLRRHAPKVEWELTTLL